MMISAITSTTAANEDGTDDEESFALPLTGGESYPLDITPTRKAVSYKDTQQNWPVTNIVSGTTPKSTACVDYYDQMYGGYLDD